MTNKNERDELIKRFEADTDLDLSYILEQEPGDIDELMDELETQAEEIDVIYYHNAMAYLSENDPSLRESLELAAGMGYEAKDLSSGILATLLMQQNVRATIEGYRDELEAVLFDND